MFYSKMKNYNFCSTYKEMIEKKAKHQNVLYLSMLDGYVLFDNYCQEEDFYIEHIKPYDSHYIYYQFADIYKRIQLSMIMDRSDDLIHQTRLVDTIENDSLHIQNCTVPKLGYTYTCFRLTTGSYNNLSWLKILPEMVPY